MFKRLILSLLFLLLVCCQQPELKIFLAGDSTMAEKLEKKRPETGWGEKLSEFFDSTIVVENHAKNGRSTRTFIEQGRWQKIIDSLHVGDYVFIQFGHNDQSKKKVDRYTPPNQFKANLVYFVKGVREKGGIPVLLTPVVRRRFNSDGMFYDVHGEYPDLVREVASSGNVALLELHKQSQELLIELGGEKSKELFLILEPGKYENYPEGKDDNTHFSDYGATIIASLVVDEIKNSKLNLKNFIIDKN